MGKDLIAITASFLLGACVGLVGMHLGMKPAPCGQAAVSLQPARILKYKTIVCSFSDEEQNYFCSPWEPASAAALNERGRLRSTPKQPKDGGTK